jgi:D-beta-D-heptose 7-phosphate kinase/D-beta-D-heptose 1-phosphate adenosyltransferase
MSSIAVVGDALLDCEIDGSVGRLCPEAPVPVLDELGQTLRPGGAALAASLLAQDGHTVVFVTALAQDVPGHELASLLAQAGVADVVDLGPVASTAEKVRLTCDGRILLRLDRGDGRLAEATSALRSIRNALSGCDAVLAADYGRGVCSSPSVRSALDEVAQRKPLVWDPHPLGDDPPAGCRLATPNVSEATRLTGEHDGARLGSLERCGRQLMRRWRSAAVAITLGPRGALLIDGPGPPLLAPARSLRSANACGAGDRFSSVAAAALANGVGVREAIIAAVEQAAAYVATNTHGDRAGEAYARGALPDTDELVERVRRRGGTVVATGGCFDLLHAGHVATLEAARALGDCLVVCLNSDRSVRELKGAGRPLVCQEDRAAVLSSVRCVDAVAIFDEPTPATILGRLRPDVWAKGGDYEEGDLPEAEVVHRFGGQVVILPYVTGRSTTRLIAEALASVD